MAIQLSEHFNYKKLFKFTLPSIIMMIFTSIYGVVDGIFVSNFVGKTAFTAVNFVMPVIMVLGAAGFIFGPGGSAIVAKTMGEKKSEEANKQFSMVVYAALITGVANMVLDALLVAVFPFGIVGVSSLAMFVLAEVLAYPLSMIFMGYDKGLLDMTVRGFFIYSFSFLFAGVGIWSSSFFTALNNGPVSAIISFLRTLVFQVGAVLILPLFLKLDGIWLSIVVAEFLAVIVGGIFIFALRKKYNY